MCILFWTLLACRQGATGPMSTTTPTTGETASDTASTAWHSAATTTEDTGAPAGTDAFRPTWIRAWGPVPELVLPSGDGRVFAVVGENTGADLRFGLGDPDERSLPSDGSALLLTVDPATGLPVDQHRISDGRWSRPFVGAPDPEGIVLAFRGRDGMVVFPDDGGPTSPSWTSSVVARVDAGGRPRWAAFLEGSRITTLATAPDGSVFACGEPASDEVRSGTLVSDGTSGAGIVAAWSPSGEPRWLLVSGRTGGCTGLAADDARLWVGWRGTSRPDRTPSAGGTELLALDAASGAVSSVAVVDVLALSATGGGVDVVVGPQSETWLRHADPDGTVTAGFHAFSPSLRDPVLQRRSGGWMLWGASIGSGSFGVEPAMEVYASAASDRVIGLLDGDGHALATLDAGTTSVDTDGGVVELADGGVVAGASGVGYIGAQRRSPDALGHGGGGKGWLVRWDPVR
ncbi:MAG: hypothetical protein H6738_03145 [Alphaproteobacteria bacterium]|nr:hypothetical protein [Alphaproteobacteria bacterium]MCB9695766.1 hypothetical protein [Alphaproteobacteria bacterium]